MDSVYKIGSNQLNLPKDHPLPIYQKHHPLYDKFLPLLVQYIDFEKAIIDVGANIGDTTIAMVQNCKNPIYAVEPSDIFYSFLEKNINNLDNPERMRITCHKKIIGTGNIRGEFSHKNGTASIKTVASSGQLNFISLDSLVNNHSSVELIKVDTDGFDYDVLFSSREILEHSKPIIFWENQMLDNFQKEGYTRLYSYLNGLGYEFLYIFDNYGNLMIEQSDFETLQKLNSYVSSMDCGASTRTFFYTDVLASTKENFSKVQSAIEKFKKHLDKRSNGNSVN